MRHYLSKRILSNQHRTAITLVGTGGTGSHVLNGLAMIDCSMRKLGFPGLHVTAYDDDTVSEANLGRQAFGQADVGRSKAEVLISRQNGYYGTDWDAVPERFPRSAMESSRRDIIITCVDSPKARFKIAENCTGINAPEYWLDFGNSRTSGQVILGTLRSDGVDQPESQYALAPYLSHFCDLFPHTKNPVEEDDTPSCSLHEALLKQDLFVNAMLADLGCNLLWNFFRNGFIGRHGFFMEVEQGITSPLPINNETWSRFGYEAKAA